MLTVKLVELAPLPTDCPDGDTVKLHGTPTCDTVNVWLAIVAVPMRSPPLFALTEIETVPLPAPDAPSVTEIQPSLLDAVHVQ